MCIIVVKDKDKKLPKTEYLENCFDNNPDGAGFMYTDKGKVIIDKGYMTYKNFLKHYNKLCKKYNDFKNKSLIMHFRIGTAGANSKQNTHPYPISDNKKLLHKTYLKTDLGVAHNGIIQSYNPPKDIKDINDTQNFIMNYLYPVYSNWHDFYKNYRFREGLEDITNSKLAFLDKNDTIKLVGDYEEDENGIKYSNGNYKPFIYSYSGYYDKYFTNTKYDDYKYDDKNYAYDYSYDLQLEPNWYFSIDKKEMELVGTDRDIIYDYYDEALYQITKMGSYVLLGNEVEIFDENGEEVIF